ncbi:MAG: diiron oxygenase [Nannocystaceae bacterium]|nr:diiron oxygenase [Nannocystaceae bacterium]
MINVNYDYASIVRNSEKVAWLVDDVMPRGKPLDFSRPFLPEALAPTRSIACLSDEERLTLNHISGNAYLNLFAFLEEYIVATAVTHAQAEMFGDHDALRALTRFADEELKHQQLFQRYRDAFDRDFGHECKVLDEPAAVAGVIMSNGAIAVLLVTLHLEIMTQSHYTECVRNDLGVDPLFASMLKHHWLEEAQHAKIDILELNKLIEGASAELIAKAFDEYLGIIDAFDGLLAQQAQMDLDTLAVACKRSFTGEEVKEILAALHRGLRQTFLHYGMSHPQFVEIMAQVSKDGARRIAHHAEKLI